MEKLVILSDTYRKAADYVHEHKLRPSQYIIATEPFRIKGLRGLDCVVVGSPSRELLQEAQIAMLKHKEQ